MAFPNLRHFGRHEFRNPDLVDPALLLLVDEVRDRTGHPIYVKSDARHRADMERIYGPDDTEWPNSPHQIRDDGFGHGLDLRMHPWNGTTRFAFVRACIALHEEGRWPNLGIELADQHLHVDNDPVLVRPWLWTGRSR
jgi:hypothetical protein